jgi:hypothetical protein
MGEYLKDSWYINMNLAIDYTASNKDPLDPDSLHHYIPGEENEPNDYEIALQNVGAILEHYAKDKQFSAYGFGGVPEGAKQVSHCFNINGL